MDLFSGKELIIMVAILGSILLIIAILTILDFIDERKSKKNKVLEESKVDAKEEMVIKTEEPKEVPKQIEIEEIEVLDFDEPVIEMKEELDNNVVENIISENIALEEIEEITFNDVCEEIKVEVKEENIVEVVNEQERAKEELKRLEVELEKEEDFSNTITNFELEQEENAIISYDELIKNIDRLYDQNEVVQYDDGNEPITIDEVIKKFSNNEMVFENTANLDKLNREIGNNNQSYVKNYENE